MPVRRDDEGVPVREVAVERADADAGARRHRLQRHVLAELGERRRRGAEMLHPPDLGIRGNSHMLMQDKNNLQIADLILAWIGRAAGPGGA